MLLYVLRRLLIAVPVLLGITVLVFVLVNLQPGDPNVAMISPDATEEQKQRLLERMGYFDPIWVKYLRWLGLLLAGDLGWSLQYGAPVTDIILSRLGNTALLAATSLGLAVLVAVPIGLWAGLRRNGAGDLAVSLLSFVMVSIPAFFLGMVLIKIFAADLRWLPTSGVVTVGANHTGWDHVLDVARHLILPASVLAITNIAIMNRYLRGSVSILFGGRDLARLPPGGFAGLRGRGIAMVFQDPAASLDPVFSIGFQLDETIRTHQPGLSRAARRARAVELLTLVEIPQPARRLSSYPHQLSGGQLQRVMLAIALAGNPQLLLADEPTTALDATIQQEILDLLRRLNRDLGMSILLVTHDMGVVADIAQRVVVMRHGRVIEDAPVRQLFDAPAHDYTRALLAAVPSALDRAATGKPGAQVLGVDALRVRYPLGFGRGVEVVRGVSLAIREGEFLGLVGESGSGKSTIGRAILGLAPVSGGQVSVFGHDPSMAPGRKAALIRAGIGVVFQSPSGSLNPRLTIGQSIAEPLRVHGDLAPRQIAGRVAALLERVRLPAHWAGRYPRELSGGQKQRVAIARAIALSPRLLIADEPTSALDVSIQAGILDLLRELQQETRFACLFISHDLQVVRNLCHRVAVLHHGQVVEQGPVQDVLGNPRTAYTQRLVGSALTADPRLQAARRVARAA